MTATKQIDDFSAFAKQLAEQQGDNFSMEEAFCQWRGIDHAELEILRERLTSYDAGERGRPVDEFLSERRAARAKERS